MIARVDCSWEWSPRTQGTMQQRPKCFLRCPKKFDNGQSPSRRWLGRTTIWAMRRRLAECWRTCPERSKCYWAPRLRTKCTTTRSQKRCSNLCVRKRRVTSTLNSDSHWFSTMLASSMMLSRFFSQPLVLARRPAKCTTCSDGAITQGATARKRCKHSIGRLS